MKINKISNNLIKPQTPTPPNLNSYKLSLVDQFTGLYNFALILFYQSKPETKKQLQESLARILVEFYPLAGRYIKNDHMIDCNDQGVEFIEAEALDVELIDLVSKIETDQLNLLLPETYFQMDDAAETPLLSIQATRFPCGGIAVAISVSHRVFDASSLGTFLTAWSEATRLGERVGQAPSFHIPTLLPYKNLGRGISFHSITKKSNHKFDKETFVKRFVFDKEALMRLKSKYSKAVEGRRISRVRLVCAIIAKALVGVDGAKQGQDRDFVIIQGMNMRDRTFLPQPKQSCGNFIIPTLTSRAAADIGMEQLLQLLGESVVERIADCAQILSPDGDGSDIIVRTYENIIRQMSDAETHAIVFSDWSKFGFSEADFGWGKPIGTSIGPLRPPFNKLTVLMSDKEGDGIEAWVHLDTDDMRRFEQDDDINLLIAT